MICRISRSLCTLLKLLRSNIVMLLLLQLKLNMLSPGLQVHVVQLSNLRQTSAGTSLTPDPPSVNTFCNYCQPTLPCSPSVSEDDPNNKDRDINMDTSEYTAPIPNPASAIVAPIVSVPSTALSMELQVMQAQAVEDMEDLISDKSARHARGMHTYEQRGL